MQSSRLLDMARRYYRRFGMLHLNIYSKLVERGFIVSELEQQWEGNGG